MNALVEITKALQAEGFTVLTHTGFVWNSDGEVLHTPDGYRGGICRHDEAGYQWSVTLPGSVRPWRRNTARTPEAARAAVEFLIVEHRSQHNA